MNLSLKQKALLQTLGLIGCAVLGALTVQFIMAVVSAQTILNALGVGVVAFFVWMFYSITLSRLEYNEKLKEMKETMKD